MPGTRRQAAELGGANHERRTREQPTCRWANARILQPVVTSFLQAAVPAGAETHAPRSPTGDRSKHHQPSNTALRPRGRDDARRRALGGRVDRGDTSYRTVIGQRSVVAPGSCRIDVPG
ncbi:hypothetical protein CSOJ01_15838 [Colletotrichum sojae]|uniref:Uncharacterized protein n=1 Tax=Colletotrichum sojae TaxID=2175907 RepID=A0A8H6IM48_9PEZI|nr:hypothetical protein CSOJ01_15838 [Colletotrichum sojae]